VSRLSYFISASCSVQPSARMVQKLYYERAQNVPWHPWFRCT
jgi:hypothetical protein